MNITLIRKTYIRWLFPAVFLHSCLIPEKPVSKEEALALAHRIERSAAKYDHTLLDNIFDEKAFSHRIADEGGLFLNRDLIKGAMEGLRTEQFGKIVVQSMGSTGSYQLIKQYEKNNRQHILFRLRGDGNINYHDYELVKTDENVRAADMFNYISGENLSKTIADALQLANKDIPKADLEKLKTVSTIKEFIAQKDYKKASQYFDELPDAFKKGKACQLLHIQITSKMSNEKYVQALHEYKSLFPNDPNMYLMMVDAYVIQKDYPKALESVNKLDSLIDKDPYQDYERGLLYKLMKDTVRAQECFEKLHVNMPDFKKGTLELIAIYFATNNTGKAMQLIKQTKARGE